VLAERGQLVNILRGSTSDCKSHTQTCQYDSLTAGVAAGEELNIESVTKDMGAETGQAALADAAFKAVTDLYVELEGKIVKRSAPQ